MDVVNAFTRPTRARDGVSATVHLVAGLTLQLGGSPQSLARGQCGLLTTILALAVAALLANHRSVLAIADWARQDPAMLAAPGIPDDGRTPCQSMVQRLFRQLDGDP
jgi:hypothetical protein